MNAVFLDFATVSTGDLDLARLNDALPGLQTHDTTHPGQVRERIADAQVLITNKIRIDSDAIDAAPDLRLICAAATGTDNIDVGAARRRGIAVANIRDYCTASVVQHVFAMMLALTRRLSGYQALLADGRWRAHPQFCMLDYPIRELGGMTLGIVGYGTLGRAVAGAARAFGMDVAIAARHEGPAGPGRVPLDRLLARSDVVSLHCPLTAATRGMIDAGALETMGNDALLINTARGALVDSAALVRALRDGRIGGAGIDVLPQEPPVDGDPLLDPSVPNLIVTPHIAWASRDARQRAIDEIAANVRAFRDGVSRNRVV